MALGSEHHVLVEEKKDGNHLQSYRGAVTRQVSTFEGKNANGFQCKSVSEARKDDRNHNGASSSQPRKFASYTQVNDSRFSKVGGYGGKRKQQVVEELFVKESGGTQVKSTEVSQPKQVRKALFTTADQSMVAQMGVDADGPSIEVETAKEVLHEEGEITEATMVVNNMESSIPLSNVSGEENLDKVLSNELERGEQVFMSTKEVDEDDSMVSSPLQPEDPVDEVEKFAKKLMDATRLQEGVGAEQMAMQETDTGKIGDTEAARKGKGTALLLGISSKKRYALLFSSPRKTFGITSGEQVNEGNVPTHHGTVKGGMGGNKPPKPNGGK